MKPRVLLQLPGWCGLGMCLVRGMLTAGLLLGAIAVCSVQAAPVPRLPVSGVKFICPMGKGGDTDFNGRKLAEALTAELKIPFEVDNQIGGNGQSALEQFQSAPPDGSTFMLMNSNAINFNDLTGFSQFNYRSFPVVAVFAQGSGEAVVVPAGSPYGTLEELLAAARARPDKVSLALTMGGGSYLLSQIFESRHKALFRLLDAGDGAARLKALQEGRVDAAIVNFALASGDIREGRLKALATTNSTRLPDYPDIPTISEAGISDYAADIYYLLLAPRGIEDSQLEDLNVVIGRVGQHDKDYRHKLRTFNGQEPKVLSVIDSLELLRSLRERLEPYKELVAN